MQEFLLNKRFRLCVESANATNGVFSIQQIEFNLVKAGFINEVETDR